jgi:glycosyltransferase involved in cell wall biosynthesis
MTAPSSALGHDKLSIVLPAKNEEGAVGNTVARIRALFPEAQIIVVNDGSTDATSQVAQAASAEVVTHPYSKGNGAAIKTGARHASGDIIVFMDADGQHDPADIPLFLAKMAEGYDMVVGARQAGSQASLGRGLANGFYNQLASWMTGQKIEDLTSGFRAVRADKFRQFLYLLPNGFSYPTTSTMAFFRAGYGVAYIPIMASKRIGQSHIHLVKDGIRFLLIIFKIGTLYSPLKLFLPVAMLHFVVGLGYYINTYSEFSRLSLASVFLWSAAVTIFLIGLVSEQITQLMYKDSASDFEK